MTVLEIVNRVLRRLRETAVASLAESSYSLQIAEMLYDVHQQCLEEHDWSSMEHIIDIAVAANTRVYDLTRLEIDGGDVDSADRVTTNQSTLLWDTNHRPQAFLFDDSTSYEGTQMTFLEEQDFNTLYQQDRFQRNDEPLFFTLRQSPDRAGLQMTVWPTATAARHIRISFWTPEDPIDTDADDARTLLVPDRPLLLGTIMLALNERGEELGEPGHIAERRFMEALAGAIELDVDRRGRGNKYEFVRA